MEVRKIRCPKIFALHILGMTLLAVLPHLLDSLGSILCNSGVVLVGANDDMLPIHELRPRMWTSTAEAWPETHFAVLTANTVGGPRSIRRRATAFVGVLCEGLLRLAGECG